MARAVSEAPVPGEPAFMPSFGSGRLGWGSKAVSPPGAMFQSGNTDGKPNRCRLCRNEEWHMVREGHLRGDTSALRGYQKEEQRRVTSAFEEQSGSFG